VRFSIGDPLADRILFSASSILRARRPRVAPGEDHGTVLSLRHPCPLPTRTSGEPIFVGALLVAGIALTMIRVCADGGAMAGAYRTCECRGFEWQVYDQTAADGPRRTVCLGWIRSWTCYQFRTGPRVACSGL
jgi:hypothetical protein